MSRSCGVDFGVSSGQVWLITEPDLPLFFLRDVFMLLIITLSDNYDDFIKFIFQLHQLMLQGKHDSPEAELVRDASDKAWSALTDFEKLCAGDYSEFLYTI